MNPYVLYSTTTDKDTPSLLAETISDATCRMSDPVKLGETVHRILHEEYLVSLGSAFLLGDMELPGATRDLAYSFMFYAYHSLEDDGSFIPGVPRQDYLDIAENLLDQSSADLGARYAREHFDELCDALGYVTGTLMDRCIQLPGDDGCPFTYVSGSRLVYDRNAINEFWNDLKGTSGSSVMLDIDRGSLEKTIRSEYKDEFGGDIPPDLLKLMATSLLAYDQHFDELAHHIRLRETQLYTTNAFGVMAPFDEKAPGYRSPQYTMEIVLASCAATLNKIHDLSCDDELADLLSPSEIDSMVTSYTVSLGESMQRMRKWFKWNFGFKPTEDYDTMMGVTVLYTNILERLLDSHDNDNPGLIASGGDDDPDGPDSSSPWGRLPGDWK